MPTWRLLRRLVLVECHVLWDELDFVLFEDAEVHTVPESLSAVRVQAFWDVLDLVPVVLVDANVHTGFK